MASLLLTTSCGLADWHSALTARLQQLLHVCDVGAATGSLGSPCGSSTPPFRRPILRPGPQLACIHKFRRSDSGKQARMDSVIWRGLLVRWPGKQKPALPSCTQQSDPYCSASLSQLSGQSRAKDEKNAATVKCWGWSYWLQGFRLVARGL